MSQPVSRSIAIHGSPVGLMVFPPEPFNPFPIPQFPLSQAHWLDHLSKLFMRTHQRCLCVSLILDAQQQKWIRPQIPSQRCSRDGVCWNLEEADYADRLPSNVIGGSYQSAMARSLDEAIALVPAIDGVHLVNIHTLKPCIYVFVHHDNETKVVDATQFFIDDVAYALATHAEQLVLA